VGPLFLALAALASFFLVLGAHGFLPGRLPNAASAYLAEGSIRCLNELGLGALTSWCHDFGEPLGYPMLTGGPVLVLGALLMYLPGVDSYGAYVLAGGFFDALALAGGYGLMRRLGVSPLVALGTGTMFLLAPTIIGMRSFGGTFAGFALLPAYAWCDLVLIEAAERRRGPGLALLVAFYVTVRTGALFLDGYSFLAAGLVGGCLWLAWIVDSPTVRMRKVFGGLIFVGATAVAVAAYQLYVPDSYEANPIEVFRSMGLDVITLVAPSAWSLPGAELDYAINHKALWGDGTNSGYNYVGLGCLVLATAYLLTRPMRREALAIAAAGLAALVLSLGPSLKLNEARSSEVVPLTYESYLMPEGVASLDFPWAELFTAVPGLDSTRAAYRWFGVTRLALIVLAGLGFSALLGVPQLRRWAVLAVGVVAVVELLPNIGLIERRNEANYRYLNQVRAGVEVDLDRSTRDGERAFFLSYDGSHNDYMVNFLSSGAGLRAFNAGGDKNVLMSQRRWPPEIISLMTAPGDPAAAAAALRSDAADVLIAPFFHARWSAYSWPPDNEMRSRAASVFSPVLRDPAFQVQELPWFATIRLRH
jgi:hypothetical protein